MAEIEVARHANEQAMNDIMSKIEQDSQPQEGFHLGWGVLGAAIAALGGAIVRWGRDHT
jgi:hypothetical protein